MFIWQAPVDRCDQRLDEAREITKQVRVESARRAIARRGRGEVGPFKGDGEAAALGITQDERVDPPTRRDFSTPKR